MKEEDSVGLFRKFADFWDGMKNEFDELFGQSEEDLIFRKLTGIDELFVEGKINRLILSRPAVEAGERLGFLPGDMKEKIDPYLRPLYDALYEMMPGEEIDRKMVNNLIEIAPLAFMRGRTLNKSFIILDEAQNTLSTQMKMFLTRLGQNSKMVITGDLSQKDLPDNAKSGMQDAMEKLEKVKDIGFVHLNSSDVCRHTLVEKIINAYDK